MTPVSTHEVSAHSQSRLLGPIRFPARFLAAAANVVLLFGAVAQHAAAQTPTMIVVRARPEKSKNGEVTAALPALTKADIGDVKLNGKIAPITDFQPLLKGPHVLQLMVLLDSMEMIGANGQFDDLKQFFHDMPSNVEIGVGYLLQGNVKVAQPPTTDRDLAVKAFHQQTREEAANPKNDNGNPYSCLKQLAYHWPNGDPQKLRAVLIISDGITRSNGQSQSGDQNNPDVEGASQALQKEGIVPYGFFYMDPITPDPNRSEGGSLEGQTNYTQLAADTGGAALYEGMFAPSSFSPLLNKLYTILASESVITVAAPAAAGKEVRLDIKSTKEDIKIFGPNAVTVGNALKK
jgi:hypothetical protein